MYNPTKSVTITCGIQATGVAAMTTKCYITLVTCAFVICLIFMPMLQLLHVFFLHVDKTDSISDGVVGIWFK